MNHHYETNHNISIASNSAYSAEDNIGKVDLRKIRNGKDDACFSKREQQDDENDDDFHKNRTSILKDAFDQELMDALEQAEKDRISAMVTKWKIKQKLVKAMSQLESSREQQRVTAERHRQELKACQEQQRAEQVKHEEQMQFYLFECLAATDKSCTSEIGPANYAIKETKTRLGDYKIGKILGSGHYSQVHLGTHFATRKKYAVKKLVKKDITQLSELQRIQTEIHVLRNAPHPNIVELHDVVHAAKTISLVMELGCQDLQQYCEENVPNLSDLPLKEVLLGIVKPLAHLHSMGIAHCDVKPENIIITANVPVSRLCHEHIKLCDFGLCAKAPTPQVSKEVPIHGWWGGTPGYFAPEMVLNGNNKSSCEGRRADMWSLACLILELSPEGFPGELWAKSYYRYKDDLAEFEKGLLQGVAIVHEPSYFLDDVMGDLVRKLLVMDPSKRISASQALEHPWLLQETQLEEFYNTELIDGQSVVRVVTDSPEKRSKTL